MNTATKQVRFEAAHRLPSHQGRCQFVHGHSYLVEVTVANSIFVLQKPNGMVTDFSDLKAVINEIVDPWDHALLLNNTDPIIDHLKDIEGINLVLFHGEPTAENMAVFIAKEVAKRTSLDVVKVRVWETATSYADWVQG